MKSHFFTRFSIHFFLRTAWLLVTINTPIFGMSNNLSGVDVSILLIAALGSGDIQKTHFLLDNGAKPNDLVFDGEALSSPYALTFAIMGKNLDCIKAVVRAGAKIDSVQCAKNIHHFYGLLSPEGKKVSEYLVSIHTYQFFRSSGDFKKVLRHIFTEKNNDSKCWFAHMLHTADTQALEYVFEIVNEPALFSDYKEISSQSRKSFERWITDRAIQSAQPHALAGYIEYGWNIDAEKAMTKFNSSNEHHLAPLKTLALIQALEKKDNDAALAHALRAHNFKDFSTWHEHKKQPLLISLISMNYSKSAQVLLGQGAPLLDYKISYEAPINKIAPLSLAVEKYGCSGEMTKTLINHIKKMHKL